MEVTARSYLTAGIALVGATAITLAPLQIAPADIAIRADHIASSVADVSLSSLSDLIAAANEAFAAAATGVDATAGAAQLKVTALANALRDTVVAGIGAGNTAVQALISALMASGSALAAALDDALALFPTPAQFAAALAGALAHISPALAAVAGTIRDGVIAGLAGGVAVAEAVANTLVAGGAVLLAAFQTAVAAFPTPAEFVAALVAGFSVFVPAIGAIAGAAQAAVVGLANALRATVIAGLATGATALQAIISGLMAGGGLLVDAFDAALALFPTPAQFAAALAGALAHISPALAAVAGTIRDGVIAGLAGGVAVAEAVANTLIAGGAVLLAAFQTAVAAFPTPAEFVNAVVGGFAVFVPAINAVVGAAQAAVLGLANALGDVATLGITVGGVAVHAVVNGLLAGGGALVTAFQTALAAGLAAGTAIAQTVATALATGGAALVTALQAAVANIPGPADFVDALAAAAPFFGAAAHDLTGIVTTAVTQFSNALNATLVTGLNNSNAALQNIPAGVLAAADVLANPTGGIFGIPGPADVVDAAHAAAPYFGTAENLFTAIGTTGVTQFGTAAQVSLVTGLNNTNSAALNFGAGVLAAATRLTHPPVAPAVSVNDSVTTTKVTAPTLSLVVDKSVTKPAKAAGESLSATLSKLTGAKPAGDVSSVAGQTDRAAKQAERKAEREAANAAAKADRAAAKAERQAAKAERQAERAAKKAERDAAKATKDATDGASKAAA